MGVALVQLPADTFSGEVKEENEVEVSEEKSKVLYCYHIAILPFKCHFNDNLSLFLFIIYFIDRRAPSLPYSPEPYVGIDGRSHRLFFIGFSWSLF